MIIKGCPKSNGIRDTVAQFIFSFIFLEAVSKMVWDGRWDAPPHFDMARPHLTAESKYSKLRATDPARSPFC